MMCWLFAFVVLFVIAPSCAYAYLDPGTGSILLQGAIAALAGGLMAIRSYWQRIVGLFRRSESKGSNLVERPPQEHA
jgi:hypothetical protein